MKIDLTFNQSGQTTVRLVAESEAERAILSYMTEGIGRTWRPRHQYTYRPAGVPDVTLEEYQLNPPARPTNEPTNLS